MSLRKAGPDCMVGKGFNAGRSKIFGPYGSGEWTAPKVELGNQSVREWAKKNMEPAVPAPKKKK